MALAFCHVHGCACVPQGEMGMLLYKSGPVYSLQIYLFTSYHHYMMGSIEWSQDMKVLFSLLCQLHRY